MAGRVTAEVPPGGYDEEMFVTKPVDPHWKCAICLDVMRNPVEVTGKCGHMFCHGCITTHLQAAQTQGRKACCPQDNETLPNDGHIRETVAWERMILAAKVRCVKTGGQGREACDWTGELRDLDRHLADQCLFCEASCPQNCSERITRRLLSKHITDDCIETLRPCEFQAAGCGAMLRVVDMELHVRDVVGQHLSCLLAQNHQQSIAMRTQEDKVAALEAQSQQQSTIVRNQADQIAALEETVVALQRRVVYSFTGKDGDHTKFHSGNTKLTLRLYLGVHHRVVKLVGPLVPNQQLRMVRVDDNGQQCTLQITFNADDRQEREMTFGDVKGNAPMGATLRGKTLASFHTGGSTQPDVIDDWTTMPTSVTFKFYFVGNKWYTFEIRH